MTMPDTYFEEMAADARRAVEFLGLHQTNRPSLDIEDDLLKVHLDDGTLAYPFDGEGEHYVSWHPDQGEWAPPSHFINDDEAGEELERAIDEAMATLAGFAYGAAARAVRGLFPPDRPAVRIVRPVVLHLDDDAVIDSDEPSGCFPRKPDAVPAWFLDADAAQGWLDEHLIGDGGYEIVPVGEGKRLTACPACDSIDIRNVSQVGDYRSVMDVVDDEGRVVVFMDPSQDLDDGGPDVPTCMGCGAELAWPDDVEVTYG